MISNSNLAKWGRVIGIDFEYRSGPPPEPVCMIAIDFNTGKKWELFFERNSKVKCPIDFNQDDLAVAHNFSAEASCFGVLGWELPLNICCTMAEYRNLTNGIKFKYNLLEACNAFGISCIESNEKDRMRDLALRGWPYTKEEQNALLEYCSTDVRVLAELIGKLNPDGRSLIRGRYAAENGLMSVRGLPVDKEGISKLEECKVVILLEKAKVINCLCRMDIFCNGKLSVKNFEEFLLDIDEYWPSTEKNSLKRDNETLKSREQLDDRLPKIRQLLKSMNMLRKYKINVGADSKHRYDSIPFATSTGRTQMKGGCLLSGPAFLRSFIQSPPGKVLIIADYKSQETLIAAVCSGDEGMAHDYYSGDFYFSFAKRAGAVADSAKRTDSETTESIRSTFKVVALAVQYGMGATSLADKLSIPDIYAKSLLRQHKRSYPKYWEWVEKVKNIAAMDQPIEAILGWRLNPPYQSRTSYVKGKSSILSICNFPIQATGSEILRATVIDLANAGFHLLATVHDSVIVEVDSKDWGQEEIRLKAVMKSTTEELLNGKEIRVDTKVIHPGERYHDERGKDMWDFLENRLKLNKGTPNE
jgi:DNA polymerase-1